MTKERNKKDERPMGLFEFDQIRLFQAFEGCLYDGKAEINKKGCT